MRNHLFYFIVFVPLLISAQEFTVFYKENRQSNYHRLKSGIYDPTITNEEKKDVNERLGSHQEELRNYKYESVLRISSQESLYYPLEKFSNDSVSNIVNYAQNQKFAINREVAEKEYKVVYINKDENLKISTEYTYGKEYLIEESIPEMTWKILNEFESIKGYRCQKAILQGNCNSDMCAMIHSHAIAWFTKEIDVNAGPFGITGLPGLVVMVQEMRGLTLLDKLVINPEQQEIRPPVNGIKISRSELEDMPMLLFNQN